jgi:hypothetical protein
MSLSAWRKKLIISLVILSLGLMIYDALYGGRLYSQIKNLGWLSAVLLLTEACFIAGAVIMAISAGESFRRLKLRHWPRHIVRLRGQAKIFAARVVASRLFAIGFWLNFIGAVGTSLILIAAVILFVPQAGWGLGLIIILDLLATFGWRVPLEVQRRTLRKRVTHEDSSRKSS